MSAPALRAYVSGDTDAVSGDQLNTFVQSCDTLDELRALIGLPGMQVYVRGQASIADGGQGNFYWIENGTGADDNISIIVPSGASGVWGRIADLILPSLTITAAASTNLTTAVRLVYVNKTVGAATAINLPATPIADLPVTVIDVKGDAVSNPITISGNGKLINGAATSVISTAFGTRKLVFCLSANAWTLW